MKTLNRMGAILALIAVVLFAAALTVTTTTMGTGFRGADYAQTLAASGGTGPYTWTLTDGALCDGLTLADTGAVSGKPTTVQTCTFTVQVQDSVGATATQPLSIKVTSASTVLKGVTIRGNVAIK